MIIEMLKVLLLGIVEGFTEWLPISSTGHMILVDDLIRLNVSAPFRELFMVVIQLGAILAVCVIYSHRLNPFSPKKTKKQKGLTIQLWIKIICACVPAAIVGVFLDEILDQLMNGFVVASMLLLYGVFFLLLEKRNEDAEFPIDRISRMPLSTAMLIGCSQILAMIPGTSRSGATILCAMLLGCSRELSAEFSFFLGIPIMFGASGLKILKFFLKGNMFTGAEFLYLVVGMAVAFIVSVLSIRFLMRYIKNHDFRFFGYYRIVLGVIVLVYSGITALIA